MTRHTQRPDHTAELTKLRARLYSPELSPLEASAMLTATELLRLHESGGFEICTSIHAAGMVRLCLGTPFELVHLEDHDCCDCCGCT
ncbi:hypothetical protein ACQBJO_00960 [Janibacter sp. G349]|uniref:hypothetical protein n=1 Tax=Janibacter sp. G349 TaxID=3405424 RepID=UPI003B7B6097